MAKRTCLFSHLIALLFFVLFLANSSQGSLRSGNKALKEGKYQEAVTLLEQALGEKPDNPEIKRSLGLAYYHLKNYAKAEKGLNEARQQLPRDGQTVLYLGLVHEAQGDFTGARDMYEQFLVFQPKTKVSRQIRGRLLYLQDEALRQQVQAAVAREKELKADTIAQNSVGVLPFTVKGSDDPQLKTIAHGLTAAVWYDLSTVKELQLVERVQLSVLIDELKMSEQGASDPQSAPRLGKMVGARKLVSGTVTVPAEQSIGVQSGIVAIGDAFYSPAIASEASFSRIMKLQKEITLAILDSLGVKLSAAERKALEQSLTESSLAFLAFSRGIEQADQGNHEAAAESFREASRLDPGFDLAKSLQQNSDLISGGSGSLETFDQQILSEITPQASSSIDFTEQVIDLTAPSTDPRAEDVPERVAGTARVTVSGSVR